MTNNNSNQNKYHAPIKGMKQIAALLILSLTAISVNVNAGWVDDWVDQSTHSGPQYFEGQKRGYFNAGTYSMRYQNKKEYLFSIQKPRLQSGCGGIDLFMGGFSFLDPEYLMEKMQRALQAAPAIAFDLALKETCPECASTLGKFEGFINELNSMQMSECELGKKIAVDTGMDKNFGQVLSVINAALTAEDGSSKMWRHDGEEVEKNNNKPTAEQKRAIEGCSPQFTALFTQNGSLLANIARAKGLEQYAPYMRAYVGDALIDYKDNQFSAQAIGSCSDVQVDKIDEILTGNGTIKPISGACTQGADRGLLEVVDSLMHSIANKIKSKSGNYTDDEKNFLNSMPSPVFKALNHAAKTNTADFQISVLREPTARAMAFAIIDDLVDKLYELSRMANTNVEFAESVDSNKMCSPGVLGPLLEQVKGLKFEAAKLSIAIKKARSDQVANYVDNINFNNSIRNQIQGSNMSANQLDNKN